MRDGSSEMMINYETEFINDHGRFLRMCFSVVLSG